MYEQKEFSCLNVCFICDDVGRILYINNGFPVLAHHTSVWTRSAGSCAFDSGIAVQGYTLLGDSGYSSGACITTPYRLTSFRGEGVTKCANHEHAGIRATVRSLEDTVRHTPQ